MNFCKKCGTKNRNSAKFCSRCGAVLEVKSTPPAPPPASLISGSGPYGNDLEPGYDIVPYEYENNYFGPPRIVDEAQLKVRRARQIIRNYAIPAAGLVALPIPFSDIYFLLPIQGAMILSIGKVYKSELRPEKVIMELVAACGFSVLGQISTLIVANFLPLGSILSAPFVYGWTVGMGEAAIKYYESKGNIDYREIRYSYRNATEEGKRNYGWHRKMSKEESLENLRNHLTPDEYERIKKRFYPYGNNEW